VATAEIRYGDNDRLAARVAQMAGADCLVLLSDIDGLYTANPNEIPTPSSFLKCWKSRPEIEAMAGGAGSAMGSGGMQTKIAAAKIAVGAGCHLCISKGPISIRSSASKRARAAPGSCRVLDAPGHAQAMDRRALQPAGEIAIDEGAVRALMRGKSLLPAGVTRRRALRARRYGQHRGARRRRGRARHLRVFGRRCGADHGPQVRGDRKGARISRSG
jgi:glutamate 5-kinase